MGLLDIGERGGHIYGGGRIYGNEFIGGSWICDEVGLLVEMILLVVRVGLYIGDSGLMLMRLSFCSCLV